MADGEHAQLTNKPKKRKIEGRTIELKKRKRLSSQITGPDCKCSRFQCFQNVNQEDRDRLLASFNALSSKDLQYSFLAGLITVQNVHRRRPLKNESLSSIKQFSFTYKVFSKANGEEFVRVCLQGFVSIFGIKKGRVETIKKSLTSTGEPPKDQRGMHKNRPHKLTEEMLERIRNHISSFQGRQSHYSKENTRRLYLPEELNINKMFNMFLILYPESKLCYESYRNVFNKDFNIGFGYPRTDTCSKCDEFKVKIDILTKGILSTMDPNVNNVQDLKFQLKQLETEREVHQRKADAFYRRKREARLRAMRDLDFAAITFDFNKNLNIPNNSSNDFYYRRKLSFYSFNIHVLASKDVYIYDYDETTAKKGADEVTSMLLNFFMNHLSPSVRHLELFCDSCAGQNKNYTVIRFLDYLIQHKKRFNSIKISFPERGHSYMECDKDMGLINCKTIANVPSDWIKTFENARRNPTPFNVFVLQQSMVRNITSFIKPFYKAGCPVPTRPLREISFSVDAPGIMVYRDSWNGSFLKATINTNLRNKRDTVKKGEATYLYTEKLCISVAKFKDLQVLKKFTNNPEFFDSLSYDNKPDEQEFDEQN